MTIHDPQLVTILVFWIAGLFLVQTLCLLVFVERVNRRVRRAEKSLVKLSKRASAGLRKTQELLLQVSRVTDRLPSAALEVNNLLETTSVKARQINSIVARDIHLSTVHIEEAGRRIEFALSQLTRQTSKVRKWIRYPSHCVSAIIHGAFTGVRTYTRDPQRGQPATHYPDDEIFI